jgi:DNA helicase-2/ATP-dependent DNA helicase PcrA
MPKGTEPDLLADLTPAQREAVTHFEGPLLILAGAGSGKTRVLTRRVAYLLQQGVKPYHLLAITFTNKAATEMRQRIEALVPDSRVWISTFHSLGARLLRLYADRLGLERNFTIYDQHDRNRLVKAALEAANIDNIRFTPERIEAAISKAKNQLVTAERYAQRASDFFSQTVAHVYPVYEKKLRDANALDFDDLLLIPALALQNDPELRAELDARFRFVLIDEYQDTNSAQYAIARGLSRDYPNLCVVGDPDQCLPPGTLIQTPVGPKPIETLWIGDRVTSAMGWGGLGFMAIDQVMINPFKGRLVHICLEGGTVLRATPNHMCFARLQPSPSTHYVYLMWKKGVGYRLGTTRGVRSSKDGIILSGLQVRTNQEVADAIWIVRSCRSSAEARFYEHLLSVRYGVPTMVFFVRGRRMDMTQEWIDRLYQELDTEAAASRLMADFCLDVRYPHHRPGAVTRAGWARRHVLFTMFGDARSFALRSWHEHRVQLVTSGQTLRAAAEGRFRVRDGQRGTWRIETSRKDYEEGMTLTRDICSLDNLDIVPRARIMQGKAFAFMPASHIHPGMIVPVWEEGRLVERVVAATDWDEYEGPVYDLSVPHTRNFIANNLVVHNSIYAWRGANIRNILDFERDFPDTRVITLERNYRSTKSILRAASSLIAHNRQRKPKDLVTENPTGQPVTVLTFENGVDEADGIAQRIRASVQSQGRNYHDFAVFLRINALSRGLEAAFLQNRVPYQIVKGLAFFERKENRDVLAYLRLLINPRDNLSFLRAVNEPARGVGKVSLEHLQAYAEPRSISLLEACSQVANIPAIKGKAAAGLRSFAQLIHELAKQANGAPDEVIRQVLDRSGYRHMLQISSDEEDLDRLANIEELITAAKQFAAEDSERTLSDWLENITLASDVDSWDDRQDCVSIMTLHSAKGLEFPVVYMAAVEHELLPHARSLAKVEDVEEERRLAFVGMTRAKEELYLCHARLREFRGQTVYAVPSMFLDELGEEGVATLDLSGSAAGRTRAMDAWRSGTKAAEQGWIDAGISPLPVKESSRARDKAPAADVPSFTEGMIVHHDQYGTGHVTRVVGHGAQRKIKVQFRKAGERTFLADKAKLAIVKQQ